MKKNIITILAFIFAVQMTYAQRGKNIYEAKNLKEAVAKHKKIAILPFTVKMSMKKLPKGVTPEMVAEDEKKEAVNIHNSMFTFFMRKADKYTVDFQDPEKTRAILKKNNITPADMEGKTKDELAKLLEVDAVISGNVETERMMSQGAGIALSVIGIGAKTNQTTCIMQINEGSNGDLLWRYDRQVAGGWSNSTDDLVERIMRQVARNFPYKK